MNQENKQLLPQMNVTVPDQASADNLVSNDDLVDIYNEIMNNLREDRKEQCDLINNFAEMVINDCDSSSSSKEALVGLVKIRTETTEKMTKIADLMTRVKLKERDTFPKYLAASQNNTINIEGSPRNRKVIDAINKSRKKQLEQDE